MTASADDRHEFRPGFEFDVGRLEAWLATQLPGFRGPLVVRQFSGGQSNPTYLLRAADRRYVLRRKPPGVLLPSAHAIDREFRVMQALGGATDVPVAAALAIASRAKRIMTENLWLAVIYNAIAVPIAILGYATPLIAALAMSGSSILVTTNSLRARAGRAVSGERQTGSLHAMRSAR